MTPNLSILAMSLAAMANAPAHSAPAVASGAWHVDYDDEQCVASRTYGESDKPIYMVLKPSPAGGVMRLIISRRGGGEAAQVAAKIRLGDQSNIKTNVLAYGEPNKHQRVVTANLSMAEFKTHATTPWIQITSPELSGVFPTPGLLKVVAALDECLTDLQDYWNVRADRQLAVQHEVSPTQPLTPLFSASDYPMVAMVHSQSGTVKVGVLVDDTGRVADCSVESTSDVASLDTMTCYVIRTRAKFIPAIDANGKPVRSYFSQSITWRLGPPSNKRSK
ncbi:MAG: energy transducer TonB [Patescibacteria group bacterium]